MDCTAREDDILPYNGVAENRMGSKPPHPGVWDAGV